MSQSTTVFDQILNLVPKSLFENLADQYQVNKRTSVLKGLNHFSAMLFSQLSGLKSLRSIVQATKSLFQWQENGGLISMKKSTLADANKRIDYRFYRDLFFALLALYSNDFKRHKFPLPGKLFTIDSTTIKLCLNSFPWAIFRNKAGAIKLHTLLDNDGNLPADVIMTNGKVHDIRPARKMAIIPKATYLLDRAYVDFKWLHSIHQQNAFFVTRWKKNVTMAYHEKEEYYGKTGVMAQWWGHLDTEISLKKYPGELRFIHYIDPETGKELWFMTNLMDCDAQTIANLYRHRWQIELFFKWIKQNLKIKSFLGTSSNAVQSQIWIAMIAYLLTKVLHNRSKKAITAHHLLIFIKIHILVNIDISNAWRDFLRTKQKKTHKNKIKARSTNKFTGH